MQTLCAFANHASLTAANARLYAELESALARQVDLNRQKGDFVAAVSHELRTPLAVMLAATHTLRKLADRIPEAKRVELLDASIEQGNRLQRLIDELLLVAAAEHEECRGGLHRDRDHAARRRDRTRAARRRAAAGSKCAIDRTSSRVIADPSRLRQILLNLVDNASKYAPDGRDRAARHDQRSATCSFAVVDHGPGIPEADRDAGVRAVRAARPVVDAPPGRNRSRALPVPPARRRC